MEERFIVFVECLFRGIPVTVEHISYRYCGKGTVINEDYETTNHGIYFLGSKTEEGKHKPWWLFYSNDIGTIKVLYDKMSPGERATILGKLEIVKTT